MSLRVCIGDSQYDPTEIDRTALGQLESHGSRRGFGGADPARPIMIIDGHELFGTTLRMALASKDIEARQLATTGGVPAILDQVDMDRADASLSGLVLLDLHLGHTGDGRRIDGVELIAPLRARGFTVLVTTNSDDVPRIAAAVAAGAIGVVSKSGSFEILLSTIAAAAAGKDVMPAPARHDLLAFHSDYQARQRRVTQGLERLSPREREVLDLLGRGYRTTGIAERFVVSRNTVRAQIRAILAKLDVNSQLEAAAVLRNQQLSGSFLFPIESSGICHGCVQCGKNNLGHWPWCTQYKNLPVSVVAN